MKARHAASIALAGALLLGTSGCTLFAIQGTLVHYEPSDGVGTSVGDLKFRNIIGLSADGKDVALVFTVINTSDKAEKVTVQFTDGDGDKQDATFTVQGHKALGIGAKGEDDLVLRGADVTVGGLLAVYLQYGDEPGQQVLVPVLDGSTAAYTDLLPTPLPSVTPTPVPTSTAPPVVQ